MLLLHHHPHTAIKQLNPEHPFTIRVMAKFCLVVAENKLHNKLLSAQLYSSLVDTIALKLGEGKLNCHTRRYMALKLLSFKIWLGCPPLIPTLSLINNFNCNWYFVFI